MKPALGVAVLFALAACTWALRQPCLLMSLHATWYGQVTVPLDCSTGFHPKAFQDPWGRGYQVRPPYPTALWGRVVATMDEPPLPASGRLHYSVGPNGIDERGAGDDIVVGGRCTPGPASCGPFLLVPLALLGLLCAWVTVVIRAWRKPSRSGWRRAVQGLHMASAAAGGACALALWLPLPAWTELLVLPAPLAAAGTAGAAALVAFTLRSRPEAVPADPRFVVHGLRLDVGQG